MFKYTSGVFLQSLSFRFSPPHFPNHGTRKNCSKNKADFRCLGLFLYTTFCSRMSSVVQFLGLQQGIARGGDSRRQDQIIKAVSCSRHSAYTSCSSAL